MSEPSVTVVMPVLNGASWLPTSIPDILGQTLSDLELIVVDDGSTDATQDVLASFSDPRLRVERQEHVGQARALNRGTELARGHWIARMDVDDRSPSRRLAEQVAVMRSDPGLVAVGCTFEVIDPLGAVKSIIAPPPRHDDILRRMLVRNPFAGGSMLFDAAALRALGGFDPRHRATEDYEILVRLARVGRLASAGPALYGWRVHSTNTSYVHREKETSMVAELHDQLWDPMPPPRGTRELSARLREYAVGEPENGVVIAGQLLRTEALIGRELLRRKAVAGAARQFGALAVAAPRYAPRSARQLSEAAAHLRGRARDRVLS